MSLLTASAAHVGALVPAHAAVKKPNNFVIWSGDVGNQNVS